MSDTTQYPSAPDALTSDDIAIREALITGRPPRISPGDPSEYRSAASEIINRLRHALSLPPTADIAEYIAMMMRHPGLMRCQAETARELFEGALSSRDSELATLRTGWLCQAPFMFGQHVQAAHRLAEITDDEIDRVKIGSAAPEWNDHERAILRAVEELHDDSLVSDDTWAVLARTYDEKQLIELLVVVGHFHGVAFLQNSIRAPLMEGNAGLRAR